MQFIEALAGEKSLGISKDQLEGYTQDVCAYHLVNLVLFEDGIEWPLVIFDTPGFADRKISEMDIVTKINQYIGSCGVSASIYAILYLIPITDIRLSGSRRRVMDTFRAMTGDRGAHQVTVVTTMWNTMYVEATKKKAQIRYEELQKGPWKDLLAKGGRVTKFLDNKQEDALGILKTALERPANDYYFPFYEYNYKTHFAPTTPFLFNMMSDVETRVDALQTEENRLKAEIEQGVLDGEELLVSILEENLAELRPNLARFSDQLAALRATAEEEDEGSFDFSRDDYTNHPELFTSYKPGFRQKIKDQFDTTKRWGKEKLSIKRAGRAP
ncbi:hypothetical protein BJ165DRAFT_1519834 [Panaeolus papilionaceus]|nr:hypothetical protein BJ165DRAFT_1519834 [Panaeolus papilionaceus]